MVARVAHKQSLMLTLFLLCLDRSVQVSARVYAGKELLSFFSLSRLLKPLIVASLTVNIFEQAYEKSLALTADR